MNKPTLQTNYSEPTLTIETKWSQEFLDYFKRIGAPVGSDAYNKFKTDDFRCLYKSRFGYIKPRT